MDQRETVIILLRITNLLLQKNQIHVSSIKFLSLLFFLMLYDRKKYDVKNKAFLRAFGCQTGQTG